MKYAVTIFIGMLFTDNLVYAQDITYAYENSTAYYPVDPGEVSQRKGYDTEQIDVRTFDRKKWESVIGGENYSEVQPTEKSKEKDEASTRSRLSPGGQRTEQSEDDGSANSEISSSTSAPTAASPILTISVYTLAIGIIVYILFLIVKNISLKSRGKKISKTDLSDHSAHVEDIRELEIDRLLREAMTSGNYRLAIRIYFLGLLKKLDEEGSIVWKKDKTNRDYLSELSSKAHYFEEVKTLTLAYEQVWYSDHQLPVQNYELILSSFKAIDQKLKASKAQ